MQLIDKPFYVYRHVRPDTNQVFYVGKGTFTKRHKFDRAYEQTNRNIHWRRIVALNGGKFETEVLLNFSSEEKCFDKEKEFIALYGRATDGGTLANFTVGGEGTLGITYSKEARAAQGKRFSGKNHPNWGKKLSAETCLKKSEAIKGHLHFLYGKTLSESWKKSISTARLKTNGMSGKLGELHHLARKVVDISSGKIFYGVAEASRVLGMNYKTLYNGLSGHRPNRTSLRFA